MSPLRDGELRIARELAQIVLLQAALGVLTRVLVHEHPCIDDLGEGDPPQLGAARRLLAATHAFRRELRRYQRVVRAERHVAGSPHEEDLPF